jgi:non-ribosomal peptide synthetase component F
MPGPAIGPLVAAAFSQHASRSALSIGGRQHTYRDLIVRTIDYQAFAVRAGLVPADRVLFSAGPGLDFYACLLAGILGSYTVSFAAPELPPITSANLARRLRPAVIIDKAPSDLSSTERPTLAPEHIKAGTHADLTVANCQHAYLSLTSGTMGEPASALVDALALGHFALWAASEFELTADDRWFEAADPSSDLALTNALLALSSGACLTIPLGQQRLQTATLAALSGTTVMRIVPAAGNLMFAEASRRSVNLADLRLLAFGGDELPATLPKRVLQATHSHARTINTYGLTEAAGFLLYHWFDAHQAAVDVDSTTVPLGQPVPGVTALIEPPRGYSESGTGGMVDEGELTIAAAAVALEICPVAGNDPVSRKAAAGAVAELHTGDLVRRDSRGFIFCGRIGREVKIRGTRVNLAKLERLISCTLGKSACVVQREDKLVALVESETPISRLGLAKSMAGVVRSSVIPQRVITVAQLPRTRAGKISVVGCTEIADSKTNR